MRDLEIDVILCRFADGGQPELLRKLDPWTARNDFLGLEREFDALLDFLNRHGSWSRRTEPGHPILTAPASASQKRLISYEIGTGRTKKSISAASKSVNLPSQFWNDQETIRNGLRNGAEAWLSSESGHLALKAKPEFPYVSHTSQTCLDAIRASVTIDLWRKSEFRLCARADCNQIYKVESKHVRIYCSQECGHLVSVRNGRAKERKSPKPLTRGPAGTKKGSKKRNA